MNQEIDLSFKRCLEPSKELSREIFCKKGLLLLNLIYEEWESWAKEEDFLTGRIPAKCPLLRKQIADARMKLLITKEVNANGGNLDLSYVWVINCLNFFAKELSSTRGPLYAPWVLEFMDYNRGWK